MKKIMLFAVLAAGCGSGSYTPAPTTPVTPDASVTGQYNLVLTSTSGRGTTNIYTNFTQFGKTFAGTANTLVCPANDLSQCQGDDAPVISITPSGTVSGVNLTMTISFPSTAGTDTVTVVGTAKGLALAGTYTDTLGDAGTWTATSVSPLTGNYNGTFNSTANPLPIPPTILIALAQDASVNLTGTATIMSSPCISSLAMSGHAIGQAFSLTDAASKAHIIAVPGADGSSFTFSYIFEPTAPSCAGDFGRGVVSNQSPWDYIQRRRQAAQHRRQSGWPVTQKLASLFAASHRTGTESKRKKLWSAADCRQMTGYSAGRASVGEAGGSQAAAAE